MADKAVTKAAECILTVRQVEVINGPCLTDGIGKGGAFAMASTDGKIKARVRVMKPSVGEAFWNGTSSGSRMDVPLGAVVLIGACWVSDKAKLCVAY